jgi:ATP synthase protein I
LGWAIDRWLGTRPWGMIVLFFLGVAAGMLNVYRAVTGVSVPVGYRRPDGGGTRTAKDEWDDDEN